MSYIRESVKKMSSYIPGEKAKGDGYIILNANENHYPASDKVKNAIIDTISNLKFYPESSSINARIAAAEVYNVTSEEVMLTNSSDEMLRIICQACVSEGEKVYTFYPTFSFYKTLVNVQGGICVEIPFEDDYSLPTLPDFSDAKVIFFPNPGAPSSIVYNLDIIKTLIEAAPNALVVIDEAYADFDRNEHSAIELVKDYDNLIVVRTFSKSYSLAGLRVGIGIAKKEILADLHKVRDYYNLGLIPQAAATAALQDQDHLKLNCEKIIVTREWFSKELAKFTSRIFPSRTNFVLAQFVPGIAEKLYLKLKERKILVRYWNQPRLNDCLRISIGTDSDMKTLLEAIGELLEQV